MIELETPRRLKGEEEEEKRDVYDRILLAFVPFYTHSEFKSNMIMFHLLSFFIPPSKY